MIELVNLCKTYKAKNRKKTKAVKNISLILPDNGMIFITGKSGSGKSTLLNLIGGLDDITSGDIVINGNNMSKFKVDDFASYRSTYVGFIFQDYHILDEFTVKENVELSADISNIDCNLEECLKAVDLEGYDKRYPTELSGGQQQRVAIARALAKDSKIILADEPTGNLDNKTTKQILDILQEISKTRLVLIVSHNLDDAAKYADRIISLDHGNVVSDVSRVDGYINEFRIENNTLYLPHNTDLNEDNLKDIINKKEDYNNIIQLDNGMSETGLIINNKEKEKIHKSKLSKEKFNKLFNLIFKRSILTKLATILIVSVLISLFYVFQAFNAFDENVKLMDNLIENNETMVIRKNEYNGTVHNSYIFGIEDGDYEAFSNSNYEGNMYKLYNHSLGANSKIMQLSYQAVATNVQNFYIAETYGTLNCSEEYLTKIYGIDGKIDVILGDMYANDYGIIITDYVADSIMYFDNLSPNRQNVNSYEELLGEYPKNKYNNSTKYIHINAIINTNYKERYKDLISIYSNLWDNDPTNDNISKDILNHKDYEKFMMEANKHLGVSYNFSPNYESYLHSTTNLNSASLGQFKLSYKDKTEEFSSFTYNQAHLIKRELTGKDIILTTGAYNKMFGTEYTKANLDEFVPHEIKVEKTLMYEDYYVETLNIVGLVQSSAYALYCSDEVFSNFLRYKYVPFAIYFDSINHTEELSDIIDEQGFMVLINDTNGISMVNRAIEIFGTFLDVISLGFLLICVIYLMHFGYKSIKSNMYEIGIITALGCNNNKMGKLFVYEILSVGIGIIIISFIGMYVGAVSSNYVLIKSFEFAFGYSLSNVDIVTFEMSYVITDLIIALVIILLSALFPLLMIRKIKPVNILKAKE